MGFSTQVLLACFTARSSPVCRCAYTNQRSGKLHVSAAAKQAVWHSLAMLLSMNVFTVHAYQSRLIVAVYALVVLIVESTHLANLAAWLTVDRLDVQVSNIDDLWCAFCDGSSCTLLCVLHVQRKQGVRWIVKLMYDAHQWSGIVQGQSCRYVPGVCWAP